MNSTRPVGTIALVITAFVVAFSSISPVMAGPIVVTLQLPPTSILWNEDQIVASGPDCINSLTLMTEHGPLVRKSSDFLGGRISDSDLRDRCRARRANLHEFIFQLQGLGEVFHRACREPSDTEPLGEATPICERNEMVLFVDWNEDNTQGVITDYKIRSVAAVCPQS
jgi:hypothetical protein